MTYKEHSISVAKKVKAKDFILNSHKEKQQIFECKTECVNFEKKSGDLHDPSSMSKDSVSVIQAH